MVKNHSDRERGNPLLTHRLLIPISRQGFFYMHHPSYRITHTTTFVTPVVGHWLGREIAQWVHNEGSIRRPIVPWANALTTELHLGRTFWICCLCRFVRDSKSMSYFSFQAVIHDWCNKGWDDAYKGTLAANWKELPMWRQWVSSLTICVVLYHMSDVI